MHVCVIGIGLIGGSIVRALKRTRFCSRLSVVDLNNQTKTAVLQEQLADQAVSTVEDLSVRPDLIVIAVSIAQYRPILQRLSTWVQQGTVVTDVGSTKVSVIEDLRSTFGGEVPARFIPGHPIAGRECSGFSAAQADLFEKRRVILTPQSNADANAVKLVTELWQAVGACVEHMDAVHHDEILALTSHLPHALAFALVRCLNNKSDKEEIFRYAAGGFADFTRIASSNPQLWKDICLANRTALMNAIELFVEEVQVLQAALENRDGAALESHFSAAKNARDQFCGIHKSDYKGKN